MTDRKVDYLIASGYGIVSPQIEDNDGNIIEKGKEGNELKYAIFEENTEDCDEDHFICIKPIKNGDSVCMGINNCFRLIIVDFLLILYALLQNFDRRFRRTSASIKFDT